MRIVVPSGKDMSVAGHFGHCEQFVFFDCEEGKIVKREAVPNPGHQPGFLPNFLADHGANAILAGGMGEGAVSIFQQRGVDVILGAEGKAEDCVMKYLKGELRSTGSVCHEHEHEKECH